MIAGLAAAAGATHAPTLAQLTARARVVVAGEVTAATSYDSGRFSVATLRVRRWLRGAAEGETVQVVERHDVGSDPNLLRPGEQVVAFLVRAPRSSSLTAAVPAGTYLAPADERFGVVVAPTPEALEEVVGFVARREELGGVTDEAARAPALRTLAFDEIAARHPAAVEDGAVALAQVADLPTTLTARERERLATALGRTDLPDRTRIVLIDAVASGRLVSLGDALRTPPSPSAPVLAAAWQARKRLGVPPMAAEVRTALASPDAAARALAAGDVPVDGERTLAALAVDDPDRDVRRVAIARLGVIGSTAAIGALERTYVGPHPEDRPAVLRALRENGGRAAAEALARLAFEAPPEARAQAVAILMMTVPADDPLLVRVRTTHPDTAVRELAEHGLPKGEH